MTTTSKFTRVLAGVTAFAAVATVGLVSSTASALPAGTASTTGMTLTAIPGTATSNFNLVLASNGFSLAAGTDTCPGDSNGGYRWTSFMVPATVDAATLTYNASGPIVVAPNTFAQPLFSSTQSAQVNKAPGLSDGLISPPTFSFLALNSVGTSVPDGAYKIGIACSLAGATAKFWEVPITIANSVTTAGVTTFNWGNPGAPAAPVLASPLTVGNATLSGSFTATPSIPATSGYTVTAVPTPAGVTVTANFVAAGAFSLGAASGTQTGSIVNGSTYSVTVVATNSVGPSPASNAVVSPTVAPPAVGAPVLTATSGVGSVDLAWTTPTAPVGATLTGYIVTATPAVTSGTSIPVAAGINVKNVPAAPGSYSFTVLATYTPGVFVGTVSNAAVGSSLSAQVLIQDIIVVRPLGALVLTQRCGVYGSAAAVSDNVFGSLPLLNASPANADPVDAATGYNTFPVGTPSGGQPSTTPGVYTGDPLFPQYPFPVDGAGNPTANYPTRCGIDLGTGKLITSGPKAGQYFTATGRMAQITVVNTQDVDGGWTLNGRMSTFTRTGGGDSFSGNLLGWNPEVTYDSAPNLDGYDMVVLPGGVREATSTASTTGLGAASNDVNTTQSQSLAKSAASAGTAPGGTGSLGMAVIDARLRLLIPVSANSGTYTGTLTFTTV